MPLIKSTSPQAFTSNVKREIAAGRPPGQAVAIAYSEKRAAAKEAHHSSHTARRSEHYHTKIVPNQATRAPGKMSRLEQQKTSAEDDIPLGHTQRRQP
jgi:hypothetical protein